MIADLSDAVIERLVAVPGVATCERYAGQLAESARALVRVPALLFAVGDWEPEEDPGTEEVQVSLACSLFVAARNARGPEARAQDVDALTEAVLPLIRLERFGLSGVGPARIQRVVTHYLLEGKGIGIREIRWTQSVLLGESVWDGVGVRPEEIYVGYAPNIGTAHVSDYEPAL